MTKLLACFAAVLVLLLVLLGWKPNLNPLSWIFTGQGNVTTTSTIPKIDLQKLAELVTLKVSSERLVYGKDNYYKAICFVPGDARLGVDLKQAKYDVDPEAKKIVISMPKPKAVVSRVDLTRVKVYDIQSTSWWNPEIWINGDKAQTIMELLKDAQGIIDAACNDDEYVKTAQRQTEFIIKGLYNQLGWEVEIQWLSKAE